jgi:sugar/nucleoside kinase (ribokinase family)
MNRPNEVLCAGIIVADHVSSPISHLPAAGELVMAERLLLTSGGCAANVAVDLAKMGVQAAVAGRVGNDAFGRIVTDMLRELGLDVSGISLSQDADTSQTLIVNVAGEDRRFIHTFGANADFRVQDISLERVRGCRVLYLGGYLVLPGIVQTELASLFAAARRLGARTVLDVVTPGPGAYRTHLEALLPHVDVFLPNNHEAELITGERDPVPQAEAFHEMGAATAVITLGAEGSVLVSGKNRWRAGVFSVPFVDGSGGGDAFAAGYIYGLLRDFAPDKCLLYASALGASCVRAIGTTPGVFNRAECESFLPAHSLKLERI